MKKELFLAAVAGFLAGAGVGAAGTLLYEKKKGPKKEPKSCMLQDFDKKEEKKSKKAEEKKEELAPEETEVEYIFVDANDKERYMEVLQENGYVSEQEAAEAEYPQDDDPDQIALRESLRAKAEAERYKKEHEGKIEMISAKDWDTDFPENTYDHAELWFFADEGVLTDEDNNDLYPLESYVGDIFTKTRFATNNWEEIYIRNHPMETEFKIHKEHDRKGFFYMYYTDEELGDYDE